MLSTDMHNLIDRKNAIYAYKAFLYHHKVDYYKVLEIILVID